MLKNSYAGCFGQSPAILAQFTLEMRVAAWNREKSTKTRYLFFGGEGVQGHLRSSMLTFLKSSAAVLVMISSMSVPICNHFHVRRAYSGKITLFKGVPLFRPSFEGIPFTQRDEILSRNTRDNRLSHMVKTGNLYLTWSWIGTRSWRTDGQTELP